MKPDFDIVVPGDDVVVYGKVIAVTYYESGEEPAEIHIMTETGDEFTVMEYDAHKVTDPSV